MSCSFLAHFFCSFLAHFLDGRPDLSSLDVQAERAGAGHMVEGIMTEFRFFLHYGRSRCTCIERLS
jgi:hypothetical protein